MIGKTPQFRKSITEDVTSDIVNQQASPSPADMCLAGNLYLPALQAVSCYK